MSWIQRDNVLINLEKLESIELDQADNQILFIYKKGKNCSETTLDKIKYETFDKAHEVFLRLIAEIKQNNKSIIVI